VTIKRRIFVTYLLLIAIVILYVGLAAAIRSLSSRVESDRAAILEARIRWGTTRALLGDMIINWDDGQVYRRFLGERAAFDVKLESLRLTVESRWYYPQTFKSLIGNLSAVWEMADAHLDRVAAVVDHPDFALAERLVRERPGLQRLNHLWSELMARNTADARRLAYPIQQLISEVEFFPLYGASVENLFAILVERTDEARADFMRVESVVLIAFFLSFLAAGLILSSRFAHALSLPIIQVAGRLSDFTGLSGVVVSRKAGDDELALLSRTVDRMIGHYTDLSERAGRMARGEVSGDSPQFPREGIVGRSLDEIADYLHELSHTSAWIRDGEYGLQIKERSSDDVITRNFNIMSSVIHEKIDTLRRMFEAVDEAVLVVDEGGAVPETNARLHRLIGEREANERSLEFIKSRLVPQLMSYVRGDAAEDSRAIRFVRLRSMQGHEVPVKLRIHSLAATERGVSQWMFIIADESWRARVRRERDKLRSQAAIAELRALRAQINPHFFFNTLNTIAHLIETKPASAVDTVAGLADLFRYALTATKREQVPLQDELAQIRRFLDIERLRYGDNLQVEFTFDEDLQSRPVPPMLLQPLVENAIRYGADATGRISLRITVLSDAGGVAAEISDQGEGRIDLDTLLDGPGTGLRNVNQRLTLIYGRQLEFELNRPAGLLVRARLKERDR
jgi:hypothetical protein